MSLQKFVIQCTMKFLLIVLQVINTDEHCCAVHKKEVGLRHAFWCFCTFIYPKTTFCQTCMCVIEQPKNNDINMKSVSNRFFIIVFYD